jgi:hypothetical protein
LFYYQLEELTGKEAIMGEVVEFLSGTKNRQFRAEETPGNLYAASAGSVITNIIVREMGVQKMAYLCGGLLPIDQNPPAVLPAK